MDSLTVGGTNREQGTRVVEVIDGVKVRALLTADDAAMFVAYCIDQESIPIFALWPDGLEEPHCIETDAYLEIALQLHGRDTERCLAIPSNIANGIWAKVSTLERIELKALISAERSRREGLWEKSRNENIDRLEKMSHDEPERAFRLVCESVIKGGPPLFMRFPRIGERDEHLFCKLAETCLKKLDGEESPAFKDTRLLPLKSFVYNEFHVNGRYMRLDAFEPMRQAKHGAADRVISRALSSAQFEFTVAIWRVAELAYHGVPLIDIREGARRIVMEPDELYVYLVKKGELNDTGSDAYDYPAWLEGFAVDTDHLEAHHLIFSASDELSHEQVLARRIALRRMLSLPAGNQNNDDSLPVRSKLLRCAQMVLERYYGTNFDLDDSGTWTKQRDIVDWLQKSQGLSEREAMAVDIVVRPDVLRRST